MLTKTTSVHRVGDYALALTFSDGSQGTHDFASMGADCGTLLTSLRDPGYLARVFLEHGALTWPYGFDVALEWLRRRMADANELACAA